MIQRLPTLLVTATALAALAVLSSSTGAPEPAPDIVREVGAVDEWLIAEDGTVHLRLNAAEGSGTWFKIRPGAQADVAIERMVLDAILESETNGGVLTVTGDQERALSGESPEEALPLISIGRR